MCDFVRRTRATMCRIACRVVFYVVCYRRKFRQLRLKSFQVISLLVRKQAKMSKQVSAEKIAYEERVHGLLAHFSRCV